MLLPMFEVILTAFTFANLVRSQYQDHSSSISPADRIYTGDQTSNTITVISPFNNTILGTINLGSERLSDVIGPQYLRVGNSHGLGFSRDGAYIASISTTTNSLTVIRTLDNSIVSQTSVDRASHEGFFAADNRHVWVACRGTSNVDIVDGITGGVTSKIATDPAPSKVLFSLDGKTAYVNHIKSPTLTIIDVESQTVRAVIPGLADVFSSDMAISQDGRSIWAAHKMVGKVSVIDLTQQKVIAVLTTGPETNHPNFAVVNGTSYGFVTVAALNQTQVFRQDSPSLSPVYVGAIQASGIEPHGLWPSLDGTRMYIVNEHSDTVDVADTSTLEVLDTVKVGQEGQALVYVANAVPTGTGTQNLGTQGLNLQVENRLFDVQNLPGTLPGNATGPPSALLTVRAASGLDMFQLIGRNLKLNGTYVAEARLNQGLGGSQPIPLVQFVASTPAAGGCATAPQVLAFFKFFGVYDIESVIVRQLR